MATKYYHAQNAGRTLAGINFDIYAIVGGSAFGVYATDNAAQIKALDALVADKRSAVTSITVDEYESAVKKKPSSLTSFPPSTPPPVPPSAGTPLKGATGAVVVEAGSAPVEPEKIETEAVVDKPEDAVRTGPVGDKAAKPKGK